MPRIPGEDIERLKQEVSLQRLVEAQGIALKRRGADLLGLITREHSARLRPESQHHQRGKDAKSQRRFLLPEVQQ